MTNNNKPHLSLLIVLFLFVSTFANANANDFKLPSVENILESNSEIQNQSSIKIEKIVFSGNHNFSDEILQKLAKPYEKRLVSSEELETLRQNITKLYVENGYINSGAIIPNQGVNNGVVNIAIIEGKLSNIRITGNNSLQSDYIYQRLALNSGSILNVNDIQQRIQVALQSPLIDKINAQLIPGNKPGEAELLATVKEGKPYEAGITLDNRISPSVGEVRTSVYGSILSLTGYSDTLSANMGYAEGLTNYGLIYNFPLFNTATRFETYYNFANAEIIEQSISNNIDISSRTWTSGFKFILSSDKSINQKLKLSVGIERRFSKTLFDDEGVPLTPGIEPDGESHITALRISQDILFRNRKQVFAMRMTLSYGLNALGSTQNENHQPSSDFHKVLGQAQFAQQFFANRDQLVIRLDGQLAQSGLLPMEQFGIGGRLSIRGYRENQLLRDNGYAASIEYRITTPVAFDSFKRRRLQTVMFVDTGGAWYDQINRNNRKFIRLTSAGLGFRWEILKRLDTQFYWAYAFNSVDTSNDNSIQDHGIHFSLQYSL